MGWESAERVQKNDAGEFRALIGGEWVPVSKAQKSDTGEFRVDRGALPAPAPAAPTTARDIPGMKGATMAGDADKPDATLLEKIAAFPVTRLLTGVGSTGLAGLELLPGGAGQFFRENNQTLKDMTARGKASQPDVLRQAGDIYGVAGDILDPAKLKVMKHIPIANGAESVMGKVAQFGQNVGTGTAAGGLMAMGAPVGDVENVAGAKADQGKAGAIGGGVVSAAAPIVSKAASSVGWLTDALKGRLADVQAGRIARAAAGGDEAAIRAANAGAGGDVTSAQAANDVGRDTWLALGEVARRNDPNSYYRKLGDAQEAARRETLRAVQPELTFEEAARRAATKPLYRAAENNPNPVDISKAADTIDSLASRKVGNTELMNELNKIRSGIEKSSGNIGFGPSPSRADAEKVVSVIDGLKASLANKDNKYITGELIRLRDMLKNAVPGYTQADAAFAARSGPVNQSKVIQAMIDTLENSGGGERVQPFLNVMGRGENALLKRADQSPRFGGVEDVLTAEQLAARNKVAGELIRDKQITERAAGATTAMNRISDKYSLNYQLPNVLNEKVALANKVGRLLEGKVNEKVMERIVEGMKSGKAANEMLDQLPTAERVNVINAIIESRGHTRAMVGGQAVLQHQNQGEQR